MEFTHACRSRPTCKKLFLKEIAIGVLIANAKLKTVHLLQSC